jgi:hypothetical protein
MLVVNGREYSIDGVAASRVMAELQLIADFKSEALKELATQLQEIHNAFAELQAIQTARDIFDSEHSSGVSALFGLAVNRLSDVTLTATRLPDKRKDEILDERKEELEAAL